MDMGDVGAWLLVSAGIALGIRGIVAIVERRQKQPAPAPNLNSEIRAKRASSTRKKRKQPGPTGAPSAAGEFNCTPVAAYSATQASSSEIRA
jgi:hypothetical protein